MKTFILLILLLLPHGAAAEGVADRVPNPWGSPFDAPPPRSNLKPPPWMEFSGRFRLRGLLLSNLDLGRGLTPTTGLTVAGTRATAGETVTGADLGLLLDPVIRVGSEVRIGVRVGILERLALGSTPDAYPATPDAAMPTASSSQTAPVHGINSIRDSLLVHHLWLEWQSPIGLFAAGRMPSDWGLGIVANSGSCLDCDYQQAADRVAFATSLWDHVWAVSFDLDATGAPAGSGTNPATSFHDLTNRDDVRTVTLAISRYALPEVARDRLRRGSTSLQWGLAGSARWQGQDLPGYYFTAPGDWKGYADEDEFIRRGLNAWLVDGWLRFLHPRFHVEAEAVWMWAKMDNASMAAGMDLGRITSMQWGGVLRGGFLPIPSLDLRVEVGVASGDPAHGFGVRPGSAWDPKPGDVDGAQTDFLGDRRVDNFRFNPNYHVDEILWRRIIGTVSDGIYLRPEIRWSPARWFRLDASVVYSRALYAESPPGLARDLGLETILAARLSGLNGLFLHMAVAYLHPLDGFRNVVTGATPTGAWSLRVLAGVRF